MHVLKFKNQQLSLLDFEKEATSRQALSDKINSILGLDTEPSFQKMLEACLNKPTVYNLAERLFLKSMIFQSFDKKAPSNKQLNYLHNLFIR